MRFNSTHIARAIASTAVLLTIFAIFQLKSNSAIDVSRHTLNLSALRKPKESNGAIGAREKAGNGTLGFNSIYFINMKSRYDRLDALALQAYLSGLEVINVEGVEPDMIKDVGMPPTQSSDLLKQGEKGSWRAHANVSSPYVGHAKSANV